MGPPQKALSGMLKNNHSSVVSKYLVLLKATFVQKRQMNQKKMPRMNDIVNCALAGQKVYRGMSILCLVFMCTIHFKLISVYDGRCYLQFFCFVHVGSSFPGTFSAHCMIFGPFQARLLSYLRSFLCLGCNSCVVNLTCSAVNFDLVDNVLLTTLHPGPL